MTRTMSLQDIPFIGKHKQTSSHPTYSSQPTSPEGSNSGPSPKKGGDTAKGKKQRISILNRVRHAVSKKKNRYVEEGFDLDLTYITSTLIAMGYPAEVISGLYRNPMTEVQRFFNSKHPDSYMIYNLCSEKSYDSVKFNGRVEHFPFDDHNPAPLATIISCCRSIHTFLAENPNNVAAIHCKAGKGRTGMMISAYLLYAGWADTAEEALETFGGVRTKDSKGVTIPSQIRYVKYFESYLSSYHRLEKYFDIKGYPLILTKIVLHTVPHFDPDGGCDAYFKVFKGDGSHAVLIDSRDAIEIKHSKKHDPTITFEGRWLVQGDLKFRFYDQDVLGSDDTMFHFWLHTSFVPRQLDLDKSQIDKARKDKKCKYFSKEFRVECHFEPAPIQDEASEIKSDASCESCSANKDKVQQMSYELDQLRLENAALRQQTQKQQSSLQAAHRQKQRSVDQKNTTENGITVGPPADKGVMQVMEYLDQE